MNLEIEDLWRELVIKNTKGGACNFQQAAIELAAFACYHERKACQRAIQNCEWPAGADAWDATEIHQDAIQARGPIIFGLGMTFDESWRLNICKADFEENE